jgi:uncharacterized protein
MFVKQVSMLVGLLFLATAAFADLSLDDAKQQGLVGEEASGYLGAVNTPSKDVRALINDINDKRRAEYERIAGANKIDVTSVEQLAGKKAIEKTQAGHYIRLPDSGWQRK